MAHRMDGTGPPFYVLAPQEGTWFFEAMAVGLFLVFSTPIPSIYLVILQTIAYFKALYCALLAYIVLLISCVCKD